MDLLFWECWLAIYRTADEGEQTPQQEPGVMMAVTANLSFVGDHGCHEPHDRASQPHTPVEQNCRHSQERLHRLF